MEIGGGGGWRWLQFRACGESVSELSNPQSHTERCMNEKELAIQFPGIFFFSWRFPLPLFPIALSATSLAPDLRSRGSSGGGSGSSEREAETSEAE